MSLDLSLVVTISILFIRVYTLFNLSWYSANYQQMFEFLFSVVSIYCSWQLLLFFIFLWKKWKSIQWQPARWFVWFKCYLNIVCFTHLPTFLKTLTEIELLKINGNRRFRDNQKCNDDDSLRKRLVEKRIEVMTTTLER